MDTQMINPIEQAAQRFAAFAVQVLEPAHLRRRSTIERIEVLQTEKRISLDAASRENYMPVMRGWRWGPVWSTAWFRVRGEVPAEWAGETVALRFSCGTEAMAWREGSALGGLDVNHDTVDFLPRAVGGEQVEVYIEAACNRPLGATFFWWDEREAAARWNEEKPGRLDVCEWVVVDRPVWRLWQQFDFARQLLLTLPAESERARRLIDGMEALMSRLRPETVPQQADAASTELATLLRGEGGTRTRCTAVGHAHIDTAWLWPLAETRRKCARTFASVLGLMERYPGFRFAASQAQHYAWIEAEHPALFERIRAATAAGQWEIAGGMWIEPDCNVPSGESLIRQILHGTRYWAERFGLKAKQTYAYLPDTFGFSAILPQIFRQAGLDSFITNKLIWSDANEFPHVNFLWRGIDGTEVLSHCTPGRDYNSQNTPKELLRGERDSARLDGSRCGLWLQPFGHGDGGGGPTAESIERADFAADCEGMPRVLLGRIDDFCRDLHAARTQAIAGGRDWPVWDGELYLEYHRGTLTTLAWLKRANRVAEHALRRVEYLMAAAPNGGSLADDHAATMDEAWKKLLLNQFHDILPGSSVKEVYDDADADHSAIVASLDPIEWEARAAWCHALDTRGMKRPMVVFNANSWPVTGVVSLGNERHFVEDVPALGVRVLDCPVKDIDASTSANIAVHKEPRVLQNNRLRVELDDTGRISTLRTLPDGRSWCSQPINQLVLYDDRPRAWEAWDIDRGHLESARPVDGPAYIRDVRNHPLRGEIVVARELGRASRITQRYVLEADSPRVDIHTSVEWNEERTLLRAIFPVDVQSTMATYDLSMGFIQRPTHANTPWDRARFEVCAHRWMDLGEHGGGVAILNNGKYGHSCHGNVMGLTLLRSPMFPCPNADQGKHDFTYSIMPHVGDWRTAGVDRQAALLNDPMLAVNAPADLTGRISGRWAPIEIEVDGSAAVEVLALKRADDGDGLILRLAETHGGRGHARITWRVGGVDVRVVDLLERDPDASSSLYWPSIRHDSQGRVTTVPLRPFGLVTLRSRGT